MLKQSDEVYDLPTGSLGFSQGETLDCRQEVTKVPLNLRHEARDIQVPYLEFLDVGQRRKLARETIVEQLSGKLEAAVLSLTPTADLERLDQGKQTKRLHAQDGIGPPKFLVPGVDIDDEGVMQAMNSGDVPGVTG